MCCSRWQIVRTTAVTSCWRHNQTLQTSLALLIIYRSSTVLNWHSASYTSQTRDQKRFAFWNWKLTGISYWYRNALCGHPLPTSANNFKSLSIKIPRYLQLTTFWITSSLIYNVWAVIFLSWIVKIDRPPVEEHPKPHNWLDLNPGCLRTTWQTRSTLITQLVSGIAGLSASSDISQGSVATHLRSGGINSYSFITNCLLILTVKKFWKAVNIWSNYKMYKNGAIFWPTLYISKQQILLRCGPSVRPSVTLMHPDKAVEWNWMPFCCSRPSSSSSSSTTVGSMPVGVWRHSYYRCPPLPI